LIRPSFILALAASVVYEVYSGTLYCATEEELINTTMKKNKANLRNTAKGLSKIKKEFVYQK